MIDFGSNFRKIREKAGLSQEALGICLNLSTSIVNRIENNKRKLDLCTIHRLSVALHLDITEVIKALIGGKLLNYTGIPSDLTDHYKKIITQQKEIIRQLEKKLT